MVPLNMGVWTLHEKCGVVHVLSCFDVDPIRGLLALARRCNFQFQYRVRRGVVFIQFR